MSIEKEMVRIACKALDDKKAKDIKIIDIHEVSVIADYFVIASASNQNQVQAMVDNADEMLSTLELSYNRARQTAVTQEITEIVGGVEALK